MVQAPGDYAYSSYSFYAHGVPCPFLTLDPLYETFGYTPDERQRSYQNFVLARLGDYEVFEKSHLSKLALGSDSFLESVESRFHLSLSRQPRGRPQKIMGKRIAR